VFVSVFEFFCWFVVSVVVVVVVAVAYVCLDVCGAVDRNQ